MARRLREEVSAAEADATRATAILEQLKTKLNELQRQQEENAAVERNGQTMAALARRFRYRVPVQIGFSERKESGHLEILEVWGTRPKIEVGGQYVVRGKYLLPQDGTHWAYECAGLWPPVASLDRGSHEWVSAVTAALAPVGQPA